MAKNKKYTQEALGEQLKAELENVPEIEEAPKEKGSLSDIDLSEFGAIQDTAVTKYTTELLDNLQKVEGTISSDDLNSLIRYNVRGGERPEFADTVLTQSSYKLEETLKIIAQLQMLIIPELLDRQMTLRKTLLDPETLKKMSYEDMSNLETNIGKEIKDILDMSLKIHTQLNRENHMPTAQEKAMNAFMGLSNSDREKIMALIEDLSDESH